MNLGIRGWPRGERHQAKDVAYAEVTADVSVTASTEATADLLVALPQLMFDGLTAHLLEFYCGRVAPPNVNGTQVYLYQDGVSIGLLAQSSAATSSGSTNTYDRPFTLKHRFVPPAGRHTYEVRARTIVAGNTIVYDAGTATTDQGPMYARLTRLGGIS